MIGVAAVALALAAAVGTRRGFARRRLAPDPSASRRWPVAPLAALGVAAGLVVRPPMWVAIAVVGGTGLVVPVVRRRSRSARRKATAADAVTLTYAVAAELRAGRPPGAALAAVAPHLPVLGAGVAAAGRAVSRGADLAGELELLSRRSGCDRMRSLAAAWAATAALGAGTADVLDRLGESFEAEDRAGDDLAAAAAGPRATVAVLAALPALGVVLGSGLGLAPLHVLTHTPAGIGLAAAAAVLDGCGVLWVRRILTGALAP